MASSMMSPTAAAIPPKVIRLKLIPSFRIPTSVINTMAGTTLAAANVAGPALQEHVEHDDRQAQPDDDRFPDASHSFAHELRLVVEKRQLHVGRQVVLQARQFLLRGRLAICTVLQLGWP